MIKAPFRRDRNLTSYLCVVILLQCVLAMMLIPLTVHAQQRIDTCTGKAHDPTPRDILWRNISDAPGMLTACTLSTLPKLRANDAGITAWRYCKGTDGQYRPQWSAVTWDFLRATPGLAKDALALGFSPSDAALHNFAAKHAKTPLDAPELKAVWCPHWPEMTAGIPARLPPTVEAPQPDRKSVV